jgi:Zn-dependent protease
MFKSWRLGRVFGFPVEINLSFLLLLAFVLLSWGGLAGVFIVLLSFASVLVHELGHALVARRLGVEVSGIEMSFFGGAAKMTQLPRSAKDEILIAAAGPAVSLVLGGAGLGLAALFHAPFLAMLGWINLVIAGFNLIPALPMDGGRILRAALAYRMDYVRATDVAVVAARVFTVLFAVVGLAFGIWTLLLLAPFLWMMSSQEQRMARMRADDFADYGGNGRTQVLGRTAWHDGGPGWGSPFDPFQRGRSPGVRRFAIRQRNGRLVIEALD